MIQYIPQIIWGFNNYVKLEELRALNHIAGRALTLQEHNFGIQMKGKFREEYCPVK